MPTAGQLRQLWFLVREYCQIYNRETLKVKYGVTMRMNKLCWEITERGYADFLSSEEYSKVCNTIRLSIQTRRPVSILLGDEILFPKNKEFINV